MNITEIFGSGEDLSPMQMAARAFVMFFIALLLIRLAGMRVFGIRTAFDNILVIMLGAILSRGVAGSSPFFSAVAAAAAMIIVHKVLALLAMKYTWIGKIVKGYRRSLYHNGEMREENPQKTFISKDDLMEGVRLEIHKNSLDDVEQIFVEKTGEISVVKK